MTNWKLKIHLIIIPMLLLALIACAPANNPTPKPAAITGGVVTHHALVLPEIETFWSTLSHNSFNTVILIGPDHRNAGTKPFSVATSQNYSGQNLQPPKYNLPPEITNFADDIFLEEHSIQLHLPLIKKYLPQVSILPTIARSDATQEQTKTFLTALKANLSGSVAIIASIDFSHYADRVAAENFDLETLDAIENFNYSILYTYGPEHLDSKQSLQVVSELSCPNHDCDWQIIFHGNSAQYPNSSPDVTTSYYSLLLK